MADKDSDKPEPLQGTNAARPSGSTSSSPQLERSKMATESAWRRIEAEFGLLRIEEVAALLSGPVVASELLGVHRGGNLVFPGYQFDREARTVRSVIGPLLAVAADNSWSNESLALWLTGPLTSFEADGRPVDHLADQPDIVLSSARNTMEALW